MRLPEHLRDHLKIPLGILLPESETNKQNILSHIPANSFIITVGDATTEKMIDFGIIPSLQIIDAQEKRSKRVPPSTINVKSLLSCNNPAGEITPESMDGIKKALKMPVPVRLTVKGEEDLLVIPVCIFAPENSVVLYGQPNEGLVIVQINDEIRNKAKELLDLMD